MKFKYINYKKTIIILTGSIIIGNFVGCSNNKTNDNMPTPVVTLPSNTPTPVVTLPSNTPTPTYVPTPSPNQKIIDIFKNIEKETEYILKNNEDSIEYSKALFVTLTDFIFFEKDFKDITFNDLSEQEKVEILSITISIDNKLETKFPKYKENIVETDNNIYIKTTDIIKNGIQNINDFTREKIGEDFYTSLLEAKLNIKYFSIEAWGYIKSFNIDTYENGKEYIKNWYDSIQQKKLLD